MLLWNRTFNNNWWNWATVMAHMILDGSVTEENAADQTRLFEEGINGR